MTGNYGTLNSGSQWSYDPDEENTPNQSGTVELRQMSLEQATGDQSNTQWKESPMQNHYVSTAVSHQNSSKPSTNTSYLQEKIQASARPTQFTGEDFEKMFEHADTKSKRQAPEINVSMTHAGSPDFARGTQKLQGKHFKSKIGSSIKDNQSLSVPGSKTAKADKQALVQSLNSEGTTELYKYLEAKEERESRQER